MEPQHKRRPKWFSTRDPEQLAKLTQIGNCQHKEGKDYLMRHKSNHPMKLETAEIKKNCMCRMNIGHRL